MKKLYLIVCLILLMATHCEAQLWGASDSRTDYRQDAGLQGDAGAKSGFFQTNSPVNYPAGATGWWHLLDVRHSELGNNYAMQLSGGFFDQNLYFRKTNNNPSQSWSKVLLETDSKVGIGIQNPTGRLEVGAPLMGVPGPSGTFHLNGGQAWGHVLTLATDNSNGADDARLLFSYRNHAKQWAMGGLNNTDRFSIWEDAGDGNTIGGFGTERLTVQAGGNVGIGSSDTHGYKLAVNGNIHTQEVRVDMSGWPDYVFKPAYHLPALNEVKSYIDQNGHLPELPSAAQVEKQGVNLGEMNKLLVKKVEELTLYLIELQEQNKQIVQKLKRHNIN
jgi:hypothetical protein